jgi:hypothetical protein
VAVLANGRILIGGNFTSVGGDTQYAGMARLMPNGSLDTSFAPGPVNSFAAVQSIVVDSANRVLAVGTFTSIGGTNAPYIARLLDDGSFDPLFDVGSGFSFQPTAARAAADNRILVFGNAGLRYKGANTSGLIVLNGGPAVSGGGETGFAAWAAQLTDGQRGPNDMPFGDGVANIFRYTFAMSTTGPSRTGLPVQTAITGSELGISGEDADKTFLLLHVRVDEDLEGVAWDVLSADTLDALTNGTGDPAVFLDAAANGDGTATHRFRSPVPINPGSRLFLSVYAETVE